MLLLLDELKLLLIDDVLHKFFLGFVVFLALKLRVDFLQGLLSLLNILALCLGLFLLVLDLLDVAQNTAVKLLPRTTLELLIRLVFIHVDYLPLRAQLFFGRRSLVLLLLLELILGDVDQVAYVASRLGITSCLTCSKPKVLLLLTHSCRISLFLALLRLLLLSLRLGLLVGVVGYVPGSCLVNISKLHEKFTHLPQ